MTKQRFEYLQRSYVLGDSGEHVFDIGGSDILTRLDVELRATNGATNNQACTIADILTSFELMDGSNVVVSLSGQELAGLVANRLGRMPQGIVSEVNAVEQSMRFPVDFGRWYMDEDMSLDLSQFKNLQCRIQWNLAAINAVGATGFVTATGRLSLIAHVMEGARRPLAYLSAKRHALFTTGASGEEPVNLPVDKNIRALLIRSYEAGVGGLSGISNIRLSLDEGKEKPIDFLTADFLQSIINSQDPFVYRHDFHAQDADTLFTLLKYRESVKLNTNGADLSAQYVHASIGQGIVEAETMSTAVALAVDTPMYGDIFGYLPFSGAYWQFGTYDNPDSWLNAAAYKNCRLLLTQDNAGAATSVVVEQQVNY